MNEPAPLHRIRRVVTGHGPEGRSRIESDRFFQRIDTDVLLRATEPDFMLAELWRLEPGARTDAPDVSSGRPLTFPPPKGGSAIRICVIPGERHRDYSGRKESFAAAGSAHGFGEKVERHPGMHETETVDYIVVLSGRLRLVLEEGEALLEVGDVVIQRGTNHAWSNPDDAPCVIAAIMTEASAAAQSQTNYIKEKK